MAKKIIAAAPKKYETSCGECGTKFSYELEDISNNYTGFPRKYVTCPNCGAMCVHYDQRLRA